MRKWDCVEYGRWRASICSAIYPSGMCFDKYGNLLVCANTTLRKIAPSGVITTIAGNGLGGFSGDGGPATAAGIACHTICLDSSGNIYVGGLLRIRKINVTTGIITTYGGNGIAPYTGDGIPATSAQFREQGIVMDKNNRLYIADDVNDRIRMIDPLGIIHTVAGNGSAAFSGDGGLATAASLWNPEGVAVDACGNLYIADDNNQRIRKVAFNPSCNPTLNMSSINIPKEVFVYPNPTNNELYIENVQLNSAYKLHNMQGAVMLQGMLPHGSNTIPLRSLPPSMYVLQVTDSDGRRTVHKIMKE